MKDETVHGLETSISFSRRLVPYSYIYRDDADQSVTGVFMLYHLKKIHDANDIVPVYLGYGNIATELKMIEHQLKFLSLSPLYYDYIANPENPGFVLELLRHQYKPLIQGD